MKNGHQKGNALSWDEIDFMKKNSKHEPAPWVLGGASGRMITTPTGYVGDGFIADFDTLANAKHAIKCVNFHNDLIDAIRILLEDNNYDITLPIEGFSHRTQKVFETLKKATE